MRRQSRLLPIAVVLLGAGLVGACGSPPAPDVPPTADTAVAPAGEAASEGEVAPPDVGKSAPEAAATASAPRPAASGMAASPAASPTTGSTRPSAVSPARRADGVTPSPSIGGPGAEPDPPASATTRAEAPAATATAPVARLVSLPAGTELPVRLTSAVASDTSAVEDRVTARVTRDIEIDDTLVVPEGATVAGEVTYAQESGRVKGLAGVTVRFRTLTIGERSYDIQAEPLRRTAESTKGKDAQKIGIGAGAGAVVGGLLGGRKGAAIGAAAGGAGGTGVVLSTRGEEVRLPAGTAVTVRLTAPVTVSKP